MGRFVAGLGHLPNLQLCKSQPCPVGGCYLHPPVGRVQGPLPVPKTLSHALETRVWGSVLRAALTGRKRVPSQNSPACGCGGHTARMGARESRAADSASRSAIAPPPACAQQFQLCRARVGKIFPTPVGFSVLGPGEPEAVPSHSSSLQAPPLQIYKLVLPNPKNVKRSN